MKSRVFLDTPIFILAFEKPDSYSKKIIDFLNSDRIEVFTSSRVLKEVIRYFEKYHSLAHAREMYKVIINTCIIVPTEFVREFMVRLKGQIKEKDLEQLAVVKKYKIKYLVSYDKDFKNVKEYYTPRKFIGEFFPQ